MRQYWVVCGCIRYNRTILPNKLATQFCSLLSCMTTHKPRLDWVKEVLADKGERACPTSLGILLRSGATSVVLQSMNDRPESHRPESPEGDDRLLCPPWQLMRLTAARKA